MPTYEYQCPECGNTIERQRPINRRHELIYCESKRCGDNLSPMRLIPSLPAGIIVRGGTTGG